MRPEPTLNELLCDRYLDATGFLEPQTGLGHLRSMARRGSCRSFAAKPVPLALIDTLCAVALAAPTKSDLQQRDIVVLSDAKVRSRLAELVDGQPWVAAAPMMVVLCGNNRRQRILHDLKDIPFANDHLDAFFNATVDAGIALGAFMTAAEAVGLGCCPISAVRNNAEEVSNLLRLPDHVFPVAGLALGYPLEQQEISPRLPLRVTVHRNAFDETGLRGDIEAYGAARAAKQPYAVQRFVEAFGARDTYTWSDDKVRQYSRPERADFGAFVRSKGFSLK
ncbi:MAG: nitroreductase family protein [Rhodobacter sp.]|nr:nitroreductase family protein [Rhodobacter sp.]